MKIQVIATQKWSSHRRINIASRHPTTGYTTLGRHRTNALTFFAKEATYFALHKAGANLDRETFRQKPKECASV
jgi:hypothetical protein